MNCYKEVLGTNMDFNMIQQMNQIMLMAPKHLYLNQWVQILKMAKNQQAENEIK